MKLSSIFWRLGATLAVLLLSIIAITPLKNTPFDEYIATRATQNQEEFSKILAAASLRVDKVNYKGNPDKNPSLMTALIAYANLQQIDLSKYFDIDVQDIVVISKKNTILVQALYAESKAAMKKGLDLEGGISFTLQVNKEEGDSESEIGGEQIEDVIKVLNGRINGQGVSDSSIRAIGSNTVEVQMPGVSLSDDPGMVEVLSRPAKLEFRLAHRNIRPSGLHAPRSEWPAGYELKIMEGESNGVATSTPVYVKARTPLADGSIIKSAGVAFDERGLPMVTMNFTSEGSKIIYKITSDILNEDRATGSKQGMAIVLDGKLLSAPVINGVLEHSGQISGDFTLREAMELANALSNPLKVGLTRTSMNEVDPTLASDTKSAAWTASAVGAGLVLFFMIGYYRGMGILAMITVAANILMVMGVLATMQATFTLPGIAALVLTIGMAVDANILIYERMREELLNGKTYAAALTAGYDKAFSTIVDSNVTSLFTAIILYYFGTGPIKGFGITLGVGILATLFMALVFGRALSELAVKFNLFRGSFNFRLIKETNIDIMKMSRKAFIFSWIIVLIGVCAIIYRGDKSLSIDFTGGESTSISFTEKLSMNELTAMSTTTGDDSVGEVQASYKRDVATGKEILTIQTELDKGDKVLALLQEKHPEANLKFIARESIGASVSSDITFWAFVSISLSFLSVLLYVAVRFEFGFGVGAVLALVHDLLMTTGLYITFGAFGIGSGQFSSPMIAAILMTVGYSINDKIVVFDRMREELPLNPSMSLYELIRLAINKTFARTILTSLTTLFAALALFVFGSGIIKDFSFIFVIGIITGTFSSIFIASPIFYWWHGGKRKSVEEREEPIVYSWEEVTK